MKKFWILGLLTFLFVGTQICFGVVTTTRKSNPTTPQIEKKTIQKQPVQQQKSSGYKLVDSVKTCKPYSENLNADFMGMNIAYNVSINGWVNNKCVMNFLAKANGTSQSFKQLYGVDASDVTVLSFTPKIRCEFTKQQLDYVGDSILQEKEREAGAKNNMLKNPNNVLTQGSFSRSDERMLDVILNQGACQLQNSNDLDKVMDSLMLF